MATLPFTHVVTTEAELRDAVGGEPSLLARKKQIPALDGHSRDFIARSPFVLVATAGARGDCDVSPKGDRPGFVLVLDDQRLVIPDRPGNRRLDGMRNILENPHVGLLFLIPGKEETLRVNGHAWIVRDPEILARTEAMGKRPTLALGVEVTEVFLHCAKAFKRSGLWETERWPELAGLASMARMLHDQAGPAAPSVEALECQIEEGYRTRLY
jgi:hypothetical protein